jgi:hypothetical protein
MEEIIDRLGTRLEELVEGVVRAEGLHTEDLAPDFSIELETH